MPIAYVHYDLQDGYIHNWLAGGPQVVAVNHTDKEKIFREFYKPDSGISKKPVEQGTLGDAAFKVGSFQGQWVYTRCQEDHFIQHSRSFTSPHYLRSWAYAQLMSKEIQDVVLVMTTYGPADLWVNGKHMLRQEGYQEDTLLQVSLPLTLQAGGTQILVRFEGVALPECNHVLALRVCQPRRGQTSQACLPASKIRTRLPTTIRGVKRRNFLESFFDAAYLDRDLFGPGDMIYVRWPDGWDIKDDLTLRFQAEDGWTYGEATLTTQPSERVFLGYSSQVAEGPYRILFTPKPDELYKDNTRIQREIPIWCSGLCYTSDAQYGTYSERRQEALVFAARQPENLFGEIAKMELERWNTVKADVIAQAIKEVQEPKPDNHLKLLGLLGMLYRYGEHPEFPQTVKPELEKCILGFCYEQDALNSQFEGESLLLNAGEILAGQLYPEQTFTGDGQTGQWHRWHGEELTLAWMEQRAALGFETWNSPEALEMSLAALAHLVDLAEAEPVWELAAALMDKILFSMAVNSFKGVIGAAHKSRQSRFFRSGVLQPTAALQRLLWGMGAYNSRSAGVVSLATAKNYELPMVIANIAVAQLEELWSRERHITPWGEANLVTYKTPDYLLASTQDYRPGEKGRQEHIWQATLGSAAIVYTNHPGSSGKENCPAPNFWLGNRTLPRVAQWKDILFAIYNLPEDDWMGFTHAYFPVHAFEECALRGKWAFARKGNGYLALTCSADFHMVRQGDIASCELRAKGSQAIWLCQMGRLALDGDFNAFQEKVLASEVNFGDLAVQYKTLRGETLSFGWSAPLLCDGKEVPLTGFPHYDNPFTLTDLPCKGMEIRFNDDLLRLNFAGLS